MIIWPSVTSSTNTVLIMRLCCGGCTIEVIVIKLWLQLVTVSMLSVLYSSHCTVLDAMNFWHNDYDRWAAVHSDFLFLLRIFASLVFNCWKYLKQNMVITIVKEKCFIKSCNIWPLILAANYVSSTGELRGVVGWGGVGNQWEVSWGAAARGRTKSVTIYCYIGS